MIPQQTGAPDTQVDSFAFFGGLDLVTPALSVQPGKLLGCQNYEPDINGGYRRSGTYERFDGRTRPSSASYYGLAATITGTLSVGDIVSAGSSSLLTSTPSVYNYDATNPWPGSVVVYVPTTGKVWQEIDNYSGTTYGEFGIIDPSTGVMSGYTSGEPSFYGTMWKAAYSSNLDAVFALHQGAGGALARYSSAGVMSWRVAFPFGGLAVNSSAGTVFGFAAFATYDAAQVYPVNVSTGAIGASVFTLPAGWYGYEDVRPCFDASNNLWFVAYSGSLARIYKLDTSTGIGASMWESSGSTDWPIALVYMDTPNQIAAALDGDELLVLETTGAQSLRTNFDFTTVAPDLGIGDMRWDEVRGSLVVFEYGTATAETCWIHDVDPATGANIRTEVLPDESYSATSYIDVNPTTGDVYLTGWLTQPSAFWGATVPLIVWSDSGAASGSGTYAGSISDGIVLVGTTGTFSAGDTLKVGSTLVGFAGSPVLSSYADTVAGDAEAKSLAADYYRSLIGAIPGSGPVRGVVQYKGTVYAFRNNAGGTACVMYKSTTSGWSAITMPYELPFTAGVTAFTVGETVKGNTSTATGVIRAVVLESGAWGSAGAGRLIIDTITGTFSAGESLRGSSDAYAANRATNTGAQSQITLNPGGTYRFTITNFGGRATSLNLYGADGANRPFEFDGTYYVPINTGVSGSYPSFITQNKRYLYLAYGASVLNSSVGEPHRWQASEGAAEFAIGDTITGLVQLPGEAVGVFTRNSSQTITGDDSTTWALTNIAPDVGAVANTVQSVADTYVLDDRGMVSVAATKNYGNFEQGTVSRQIQPLINSIRGTVVDSCVVRQRNLVRIFCNDGQVLSMLPGGGETPFQFGKLLLGVTPNVVWSGEDTTGTERVFIGAADGYVYEMDLGQSQDGADVEAYLRTVYTSAQSPRIRKRYRKLVVDADVESYAEIRVSADLSYGDTAIESVPSQSSTMASGAGFWDVSNWDSFFWDGRDVDQPEISLTGTGINLSITLYSKSVLDAGHVIQAALVHFTPRRLQR